MSMAVTYGRMRFILLMDKFTEEPAKIKEEWRE